MVVVAVAVVVVTVDIVVNVDVVFINVVSRNLTLNCGLNHS